VASRGVCLTLLAAGLMAAASGCATAPVGGSVQPLPGSSGEPQAYVQPLPPPPPGPGWNPREVVLGFLHASASFALDPAAARAYLAPGVQWTPPSKVQIVGQNLVFSQEFIPPHAGGPGKTKDITVTGERIATLSGSGQYSFQSAGVTPTFTFSLARYGKRLLIVGLPDNLPLLLTQQDFEQVFQPENLYFFSATPAMQDTLVPDSVYAPVQGANSALSTNLATGLVRGLIGDRGSWLAGGTTTAFPPGTTLLGSVAIVSQTAVVNLGGRAATASPPVLAQMYSQLSRTLTSSAYGSPPVATSVYLEIDGKTPASLPTSGASLPSVGIGVTKQGHQKGQPLYFATDGLVKQVRPESGGKLTSTLAPSSDQIGGPAGVTALAISRTNHQLAAAVPAGRGCAIRVGTPGATSSSSDTYQPAPTGGPCTSLSFDNGGNLWAVNGAGIWVVQPGSPPVPVSLPVLPAGSHVLALRMAPDAVRAAILVKDSGHMQLYLTAVRYGAKGVSLGPAVPVGGSGLPGPGPTAVSWGSPYDLVAVDGSSVYQVPLTGGQSQFLAALPADVQVLSISAASDQLAVGTRSGQILVSSQGPSFYSWSPVRGAVAAPTTVAFPG
jgi:Lipoprotein LpqB beta-propeller domain/Sporulation and spore germination